MPHSGPQPALRLMTVLRVFAPFALGYFLSYLYRVVNAVIAPDLVRELDLDASALGLLTAAYFLTFAAFQLPLGILLDRYGPRRVEATLLVFAAIGAGLFAWAPGEGTLVFARALIGFGVSACLMASFKAFILWFPIERIPLVNGFQLAAGGMGALVATQPVETMLKFTDWRGVFWGLAAITAFAATLIFFVVPEKKLDDPHTTLGEAFAGVLHIFKSPVFWRVAPWTVASQATFLAIQGLWAGPWLHDVAGHDRSATAGHLMWIAAAMVAGFIVWGALAERLTKRLGLSPMRLASVGMTVFIVMQVLIVSEWGVSWARMWPDAEILVWMVFSFTGTCGVLPYAALSQAFPRSLAGRVNTGLNLLVFVFAFAIQWMAGWVIDLWPQPEPGTYATEGYAWAFAILVALQIAGAVWYWRRREIPV